MNNELEEQLVNGFKKFDQGKLNYSLLPTEALEQVVQVLQFGANKYGDNSWRSGFKVDWLRYMNAIQRHLEAWRSGEDQDPESKLPHLAHVAANCLFLIQYSIEGIGVDNRDPRLGQRFGKLVITRFLSRDKKHRYYAVECDCGQVAVCSYNNLKRGNSTSCGCGRIENLHRTHGKSNSAIYNRYRAMMSRCYDSKSIQYKDYGGRGIYVDESWHTFEGFYADMGEPPFSGAQLDRVDNNSGYSKDNCRWTTPSANARNTRKTVFVEWKGELVALIELCEELGAPHSLVVKRLFRGWSIEDAINVPKRGEPK